MLVCICVCIYMSVCIANNIVYVWVCVYIWGEKKERKERQGAVILSILQSRSLGGRQTTNSALSVLVITESQLFLHCYLFIFSFLIAVCGLFLLVAESRGHSSSALAARCSGFFCCRAHAPGHTGCGYVWAPWLWLLGSGTCSIVVVHSWLLLGVWNLLGPGIELGTYRKRPSRQLFLNCTMNIIRFVWLMQELNDIKQHVA